MLGFAPLSSSPTSVIGLYILTLPDGVPEATIPSSHITDALKIQGDGIVDLFRFDLYPSGSIYLKSDQDAMWNGNNWEGVMLHISGVGSYGGEQVSRPRLTVQNPDGMFSYQVSQGALEGCFVTRFRVLAMDLFHDVPVYTSQMWQVGRVIQLDNKSLTLELRDLTDSPNFLIPARTYSPPMFPVVSVR